MKAPSVAVPQTAFGLFHQYANNIATAVIESTHQTIVHSIRQSLGRIRFRVQMPRATTPKSLSKSDVRSYGDSLHNPQSLTKIHGLMQDADDLDLLVGDQIEHHLVAAVHLAQARPLGSDLGKSQREFAE